MQHLDEGMIHAWLDGALSAVESARVERHAAECADCAALVAEARGLVAGASRILSALDDVSGVLPIAGSGQRAAGSGFGAGRPGAETVPVTAYGRPTSASRHRRWWSRPAALAAAAGVILMAGSAIVLNKSGGRESLGGERFADSVASRAATTEEGVPLAGTAADAQGSIARRAAGGDGAAGAAAASSSTAAPLPPPAPPAQVAAPSAQIRRSANVARSAAEAAPLREPIANADRPQAAALPRQVVTTGIASAAKTEPSANEKLALAPAASPVAPPAPALDAAAQQRTAAPDRAEGRRAMTGRARAEPALEADAAEPRASARADTVFTPGRIDTVHVEQPDLRLRPRGAVASATPVFAVTGCYQIIEGGLRDTLTLSKTSVWSGTAEKRFRATVPGAVGHWSQPPSGDIHIMIGGALVTARIDPATGDLRGRVRRGGPSEPFLARRCR
jgi:hypothetical protein